MNHLEEFEQEDNKWKEYLFAILAAPVALPLFILRKCLKK
jgi:hypothetical protein